MTRRYQHSPQYLRAHVKRVERKLAARAAKEKLPKVYYVYAIRHVHSLKSYYGCTSNIKQSIRSHFRGAPGSEIAKAIRAEGEKCFTKEILYKTLNKQEASQYEQRLIESVKKELSYNAAVKYPVRSQFLDSTL